MNIFMIAHLITAALIVCKLACVPAVASLSWFAVLSPSIIALIIGVCIVAFALVFAGLVVRKASGR